ncbi:hypothetical protein SRABI04_02016 [Chryseobacterium sp. Bi04]|nr:hypothetical protein SRABI04_02016 [Chryseobacterium sp. Bi04]
MVFLKYKNIMHLLVNQGPISLASILQNNEANSKIKK